MPGGPAWLPPKTPVRVAGGGHEARGLHFTLSPHSAEARHSNPAAAAAAPFTPCLLTALQLGGGTGMGRGSPGQGPYLLARRASASRLDFPPQLNRQMSVGLREVGH